MSRDQSGIEKTNMVLMDEHSSSSQPSRQEPSGGHGLDLWLPTCP